MIEQSDLDRVVALGDADALDEVADRRRRHAAPPEPRDRRHPWIVPAADLAAGDETGQYPLRQHGVEEIEARELVLPGPGGHRQVVDQPVIERAVVLELEGAERMGHPFDGVRLAVGEVIGRVDAPRVARSRVLRVQDAVDHRVAQIDVPRCHVDLGAQHPGAVGELAGTHPAEEIEVLLDRALPIRAVPAGLGQGAAVLADLVLGEIVDIGLGL